MVYLLPDSNSSESCKYLDVKQKQEQCGFYTAPFVSCYSQMAALMPCRREIVYLHKQHMCTLTRALMIEIAYRQDAVQAIDHILPLVVKHIHRQLAGPQFDA